MSRGRNAPRVGVDIEHDFKAEYEGVFGALPPLDDPMQYPQLTALQTGCQPQGVDPNPFCDGSWHGYPGDGAEWDGLTSAQQSAVNRVVVNVGKAVGAYERLLTCGPGRFDAASYAAAVPG